MQTSSVFGLHIIPAAKSFVPFLCVCARARSLKKSMENNMWRYDCMCNTVRLCGADMVKDSNKHVAWIYGIILCMHKWKVTFMGPNSATNFDRMCARMSFLRHHHPTQDTFAHPFRLTRSFINMKPTRRSGECIDGKCSMWEHVWHVSPARHGD